MAPLSAQDSSVPSGQSQEDKLAKVRVELETKKSEAIVVSMLDEVAWVGLYPCILLFMCSNTFEAV
jgi:hypothetical protein